MSDLHLNLRIPEHFYSHTRAFAIFFRMAAKKHLVTVSFSTRQNGKCKIFVSAKELDDLDLFLAELIFDNGLYYYLCGISNRRAVANSVVIPIFQALLDSRFRASYPTLVRKHVLKGTRDWMLAGQFAEGIAQEFEVLFRRLKLRMISGYDFVRDLDDLLMGFMLHQLEYSKGVRTPRFNILVAECGRKNILRDGEIRKLFSRIHDLRTRGLHRLEREIPDSQIAQIALEMYFYFEYLDDYWEAQDFKTVKFAGKRYRRIRFGKEIVRQSAPDEYRIAFKEIYAHPCGDCGAIVGELHLDGCDMEVCPRCFGQFMCCNCRSEEEVIS